MTNKMRETTLEGGRNVVIFDADSAQNGGGFNCRKAEIEELLREMGVVAGLFLFPNNQDDGDVEVLMESLANKEEHKRFFDCFYDYEQCLGDGYNSPDLKGKLYTFMTSQKGLSKRRLNKVKSGQWQFENKHYWDIDRETLLPLKKFLLGAFEN